MPVLAAAWFNDDFVAAYAAVATVRFRHAQSAAYTAPALATLAGFALSCIGTWAGIVGWVGRAPLSNARLAALLASAVASPLLGPVLRYAPECIATIIPALRFWAAAALLAAGVNE